MLDVTKNLLLILLWAICKYLQMVFLYAEKCSTSIKVLGVMSRCYKIHSYSYKRSIYTKCVSETLQHRLTIIKEYWEAKLDMDL